MAKVHYCLNINGSCTSNPFVFPFGSIPNVNLAISKKSASVEVTSADENISLGSLEHTQIFRILREAILRLNTLSILLYGKPLEVNKAVLQKNYGSSIISHQDITSLFALHSAINNTFSSNIPLNLSSQQKQNLIYYAKTKSGPPQACVMSFLFSLSKDYIPEKFIYLWMSFNGYYNTRYIVSPPTLPKKNPKETDLITHICKENAWGSSSYNKDDRKKLSNSLKLKLWEYHSSSNLIDDIINGSLTSYPDLNSFLSLEATNYTSLLGFCLCELAYSYRCDIIHADKPFPLSYTSSDLELFGLTIVAKLLEWFLTQSIPGLF